MLMNSGRSHSRIYISVLVILVFFILQVSATDQSTCVIGTWKLDREAGWTNDIQTWNFYSDGTFKDIHSFSNGNSQAYDWGTWQYLGNNLYVVHETSTMMHVSCSNGELIHEENTNDVFHQAVGISSSNQQASQQQTVDSTTKYE